MKFGGCCSVVEVERALSYGIQPEPVFLFLTVLSVLRCTCHTWYKLASNGTSPTTNLMLPTSRSVSSEPWAGSEALR